MLQRSKRLTALVMSILMCLTMLPFALPAALAEESSPYDAIKATVESDGSLTPDGTVLFVNSAFGSGSFKYTYGDGTTFGDGKTYNLTLGVNAFTTMLEAVTTVQTAWNNYNGYYADYTGPNTIVVAPGTIGYDQFQSGGAKVFNKPKDASGNTIADPSYDQYFKYTCLGPQAGKSPVTSQSDPTVANGRGVSTKTECVLAGMVWTPSNAVLRLDGFAANPNFKLYGYSPTSSGTLIALEIDNLYYNVNVASKRWWQFDQGNNLGALQITNSYANYASMPKTVMTDDTFRGSRLVIDNFYENCTQLTELADQYQQGYQKRVFPTTAANASVNLLGNGKKSVLFSVTNSTFNGHPGAHTFRFNFDNAGYTAYGTDSVRVTFEGNYFLNTGNYGKYANYNGGHAAKKDLADTISFQDKNQLPKNAMTFTFRKNKIEYNDVGFEGKTSAFSFFNVNTSVTTDHTWIIKDNIFKSTNKVKMPLVNNNKYKWDTSSFLCLDGNDNVVSYVKDNASVNDVYAGDDFSGGINEMFTLTGGKDLTIAANPIQAIVNSISDVKTYIPASVTIVPKSGCKVYPANELFSFQGEKVQFVGIYEDATLGAKVDELSATEADGKYLVAEYKGKTTTCRVVYEIHVATDDEYAFVDASDSHDSYTFNGRTYTLDSTNRYATISAAVAAKKKVLVILPGVYDGKYTVGQSCAILGPHYGVSPNNADMSLNTEWAVTPTGTDNRYTFDSTKEAVLSGVITVANTGSHVQFDGLVANKLEIYIASTTYNTEKSGRMYYVFLDNMFVQNEGQQLVSGLGSVSATSIGIQNAKRYDYFNEIRMESVKDQFGALVSSGAQVLDINRVYVHGMNSGAVIATHASAGKYVLLSPDKTGIKVTNSTFEDCGNNGNWIYPNYVNMDVATTWGQTPQSTPEFFPNGFYEIFDNNTFINQASAGCGKKGYVLRLTYADGKNTKLQVTNNTVVNDTVTDARFIDAAYSNFTACQGPSEWNVSGNTFVNYTEPVRAFDKNSETLYNIDENYFAFIEDGKEVVKTITAKETNAVEKSDWYYLNRAQTVKSTDVSLDITDVLPNANVIGFPEWKITGDFACAVTSFDASQIKGTEKTTVLGVYKDAACTTPLTENITELNFFVKVQVEDVTVVYSVASKRTSLAHDWGDWTTETPATCTVDGKAIRSCKICATTEEKVLTAPGHTPGAQQLKMPTCEEDARMETYCVICHEIVTSTIVPNTKLGHDWGEWDVTEGDCVNPTVKVRVCKHDSSHVEYDTIPAPGHKYSDWVMTKKPTCTEEGAYTHTCEVCGMPESIPIAALDHDYVETTIKEATCVDQGQISFVCTRCGEIDESRTTYPAATGVHTWGNMIVNQPTCNSDGYSEQFCTVCGLKNEATRVVTPKDPDAHVFDETKWVVLIKGDCTTAKVEQNTCTVCGKTVTRQDNSMVTGKHDYQISVTPATFDAAGKEEQTCKVCGKHELLKVLPRLEKFKDVDSKKWYADYVAKAVSAGLFKGYKDNTFKPEAAITRAEVVTVVARVAGVNTKKYSTSRFSDVPKGHWANGAVAWAEQNKIISGKSAGRFAPDDKITREELCTILVRYARSQNITLKATVSKTKFADDKQISSYAKENVYTCQRAGIISGREKNMFAPKASATRAEISKVFVEFLNVIA